MNLIKTLKRAAVLALGLAFGAVLANAGVVSYTCDPSIAASTCTHLNTAVAANYSSTFTNATASIYITYGTTGLASSTQYLNFITYDQYLAALTSNPNKSAIQVSALSALATYDATPYGAGQVEVTSALGTNLGFTGMFGIQPDFSACNFPGAGCYNAIVTVTNDPGTPLYYDDLGGPEPGDAYDFYGVVQHETNEVLGTSSCVGTANINPEDRSGQSLSTKIAVRTMRSVRHAYNSNAGLGDGCGNGVPSAVDLFRYSAPGSLILDSSLSNTPGAYFSYDGGTTNGANGVGGLPKFYNTLANGDDYADFVSSSPDCGTNLAVQDAEGCPGEDKGNSILNDGRGEINILNAVGYVLPATQGGGVTVTPSSIADGNVILGRYKKKVVVLQNNTGGVLFVGPITLTVTQGDASQFTLEHVCPAKVKAGGHCSIAVVFAPDAVGADAATLNIVNSAPGSPIEVPITGAGVNKGH